MEITKAIETLQVANGDERVEWANAADVLWLAAHMTKSKSDGQNKASQPSIDRSVPEPKSNLAARIRQVAFKTVKVFTSGKRVQQPQPYSKVIHGGGSDSKEMRAPARQLNVPAAPALAQKTQLMRALRPLRKTAEKIHRWNVDIDATITRIAETRVWYPVMVQEKELWLDAVVIIDTGQSMAVWKDLAESFFKTVQAAKIFRSVQFLAFDSDEGCVRLCSHKPVFKGGANNDVRAVQLLKSEKRLMLLISDCVGEAWFNGAVGEFLKAEYPRNPIAIFQTLPPRLWSRTALDAEAIWLTGGNQSFLPAAKLQPNTALGYVPEREDIALPIVRFERASIEPWAQALSGEKKLAISARIVPLERNQFVEYAAELDPLTALAHFDSQASDDARLLAGYLSVVPITHFVMRLVSRALLPDAPQSTISEILLSGLLEINAGTSYPAEQKVYEYRTGVRAQLLQRVSLLNQVKVIEFVSNYITKQYAARDIFSALAQANRSNREGEADFARHFARLAADTLGEFGPRYQKTADNLRRAASIIPKPAEETVSDTDAMNNYTVHDALIRLGLDKKTAAHLAYELPSTFPNEIVLFNYQLESRVSIIVSLLAQLTFTDYVQFFIEIEGQLLCLFDCVDGGKVRYDIASWSGIIGQAFEKQQNIWVPDVEITDNRYIKAEPSTQSELALSVSFADGVNVVVNVEFDRLEALDRDELNWCNAFASALARIELALDPSVGAGGGISDISGMLKSAEEAIETKNYDQAIALLTAAISCVRSPHLFELRAHSFWYSNRPVEAMADYQTMVEMGHDDKGVLFNLSQVLVEAGKYEEALSSFEQYTEGFGALHAYQFRARAYANAMLGRWNDADRDIENAVLLKPGNAWAYFTRAQIKELRGETEEAIADYRVALEMEDPPLRANGRKQAQKKVLERFE